MTGRTNRASVETMNAAYEAPHLWDEHARRLDDEAAGYTRTGWYFVEPDESGVVGPYPTMLKALVAQDRYEP